jgi:hypothetical protein
MEPRFQLIPPSLRKLNLPPSPQKMRSKNEITLNSIFSESSPTQAARSGFLTLNFRLRPFLESWCCVLFLHSCVAHFAVENFLPFCFAVVSEHILLWRICFRLVSRLFRSLFFRPESASTSYIIVALLGTYYRTFSPPMITHYNGLGWTTLRYTFSLKRNIPLVKQHLKSINLSQILLIASSYIILVLLGVAEFQSSDNYIVQFQTIGECFLSICEDINVTVYGSLILSRSSHFGFWNFKKSKETSNSTIF